MFITNNLCLCVCLSLCVAFTLRVVYCRPSDATLRDKFVYYRVKKQSAHWVVRMEADAGDDTIAIFLRLDIINKLREVVCVRVRVRVALISFLGIIYLTLLSV